MNNICRLKVMPLLVLVLVSILFMRPLPARAAGDFNANNVISDSVFDNTNGMTASQINSLLSSYPSGCLSPGRFTTPIPYGYSISANKYAFGGNVTAGEAIYSISQFYKINPQVIMTTLQKEQSLVTGGAGCYPNTPDPASAVNSPCGSARTPCVTGCPYSGGCIQIAMGYSCPNYCFVGMTGFSNQISGGAWLLKFAEQRSYGRLTSYPGFDEGDQYYSYSGPMTPGYRQRVLGGPTIYYDGTWTTNDGTTVRITNGATASLYTYTPFVRGNQSFSNIFQSTFSFGSTLSGSCTGTETELPFVQRYYNARTFQHFYSSYACDGNFLSSLGYKLEGPVYNVTSCNAPNAVPIYRYYNPLTGNHMWTTLLETQEQLDAGGTGFRVEAGRVFCVTNAESPGAIPVVRLYNPRTYLHIWVLNPAQNDLNFLAEQAGFTKSDGTVFYTQP